MTRIDVKEVFAYYLPQFHCFEENNKWWGDGFTEWSLVRKAKKQYKKHEIPKPGYLGYYELNDPIVIEKQFEIAKQNSISSFCFWHYWFGDDDILMQKPAEQLLNSTSHVRFCFAWANHDWLNKKDNILLKKQNYSFSIKKHFDYLLPFFLDERYTKINGKPVFVIFQPAIIPNLESKINEYNRLAIENGFPGLCFIAEHTSLYDPISVLFDYVFDSRTMLSGRTLKDKISDKFIFHMARHKFYIPRIYSYARMMKKMVEKLVDDPRNLPVVIPRWDSTIRHGAGGYVLHGSSPKNFDKHLSEISILISKRKFEDRYLFVKSWNEWGEGNFMEPCDKYGMEYLNLFSKYFNVKG